MGELHLGEGDCAGRVLKLGEGALLRFASQRAVLFHRLLSHISRHGEEELAGISTPRRRRAADFEAGKKAASDVRMRTRLVAASFTGALFRHVFVTAVEPFL